MPMKGIRFLLPSRITREESVLEFVIFLRLHYLILLQIFIAYSHCIRLLNLISKWQSSNNYIKKYKKRKYNTDFQFNDWKINCKKLFPLNKFVLIYFAKFYLCVSFIYLFFEIIFTLSIKQNLFLFCYR